MILKLTSSSKKGLPIYIAADAISDVCVHGSGAASVTRKGEPEECTYIVAESVTDVVEAWAHGLSCDVLDVRQRAGQ